MGQSQVQRKCWDDATVREWSEVANEATAAGKETHFGYLFRFIVIKNAEWLEVSPNDPHIKYKYRLVLRGSDVKDQNYDITMFQDLGSAASPMEAATAMAMAAPGPTPCLLTLHAQMKHLRDKRVPICHRHIGAD